MAKFDKSTLFCKKVALTLKAERERKNLSMTSIAESAGLSQQMVSYVERGMRTPTLLTVLQICDAIGVDIIEVLKKAKSVRL